MRKWKTRGLSLSATPPSRSSGSRHTGVRSPKECAPGWKRFAVLQEVLLSPAPWSSSSATEIQYSSPQKGGFSREWSGVAGEGLMGLQHVKRWTGG